jgi:RND family efflux transporter MFP subunit
MYKPTEQFSLVDGTERPHRYGSAVLAVLMLTALGLAGCGAKSPAAQTSQAPAVTVAHPVQKQVVEWDTYTGYLVAPESVNVAARVSGLIVQAPFVEGSIVKKGDLLFVIDDRPFKADLDARIADQQKAEAQQLIAKVTYDRLTGLQKDKAVSQQDVDNAKANIEQANAAVAGAKAAVELSRLNLEWCRVLSPIDGRIGSKLVTVGNLVNGGAGQATMLTTIQSVSPMYCYVDIDEHSVLRYQNLAAEKKIASIRDGTVPCYVQLGNETGFPHEGYIDFVDNHVDPTTGTMRVRGVLNNRSGSLTPGFFARLRIPGSGRYQTLLVPDTSVGNDQNQRNVLVVNKDDRVEPRVVQLGALFGGLRSIVSGLQPDDWVIINGQMHARPGATAAPSVQAIKVDPADFADLGSGDALAVRSTRTKAPDQAMNAAPPSAPDFRRLTGNNP